MRSDGCYGLSRLIERRPRIVEEASRVKVSAVIGCRGCLSPFRPVGPVHGVEPYPAIADMDLQPVAVMLQLVHPARPGGWLFGDDWPARMNESGRRIDWSAARGVTPQHAGDILQEQERSNSANVIFRTACPSVPPRYAVVRVRSVSHCAAWPFLLARRSIKMPLFRFPD